MTEIDYQTRFKLYQDILAKCYIPFSAFSWVCYKTDGRGVLVIMPESDWLSFSKDNCFHVTESDALKNFEADKIELPPNYTSLSSLLQDYNPEESFILGIDFYQIAGISQFTLFKCDDTFPKIQYEMVKEKPVLLGRWLEWVDFHL